MLPYATVRSIAQEMIKHLDVVTAEGIREQVQNVLRLPGIDPEVDVEALVRDLESRFNVWIGKGSILESDEEHVPWLPVRRGDLSWDFWTRYREWLELEKGFEPLVVRRLDELSDSLLERLEDPRRDGAWDRRGMIVGQVQSGKTANYTALICKALDAGYKLIIVLTGMHNSLRSQTQLRLDEGVLGIDTRRALAFDSDNRSHLIGVGRRPAPRRLVVHTLTTSAEAGDFKRSVADNAGFVLGGDPLVLAVKKNASVLRNLNAWAVAVSGRREDATGRMVVSGVPLLLIDDEADVASVNTKAVPIDELGNPLDDYDVSKINGAIRQFLNLFDQKCYVGYTATPFANIFIHSEAETEQLGRDLFPRSFIINLPAPSNYVGPAQLFGIGADPDAGIEEILGMDMIRHVHDQDMWMPVNHRKDWVLPSLAPSVIEAMHSFLLTCAARAARGQTKQHKSMLIHVTRFTAVQQQVTDLVREGLTAMRNRLEFGDGKSPDSLLSTLQALWEHDFIPTSDSLRDRYKTPVTWMDIRPHLLREAQKIQVKTINGTAQDALEYAENALEGLSVITIGGDKLSRGLTLEGLTVSYYLRASKMYDTLMQMGRWFGYRPDYLDLCRLYTSEELADWYRYITLASEELRREFDMMAATGQTPVEFGLRVRTHPDGLLITAANKLRSGTTVRLSYAGDISETIVFDKDPVILRSNMRAVELLIANSGGAGAAQPLKDQRFRFVWPGVPGSRVAEFLEAFRTHDASRKARSPLLARYVRAQLDQGELTEWTVCLVSKDTGDAEQIAIAGVEVGLTTRAPFPKDPPRDRYAIRQLHSPGDEAIDLTDEERVVAQRLTRESDSAAGKPSEGRGAGELSGLAVRMARPKQRALLLIYPLDYKVTATPELSADPALPPIGVVISFPGSDTARAIEYTVNNVYWEQEFGS